MEKGSRGMRVNLKHINTVRKKLANGEVRLYYYHRLTGERITGEPGTKEFLDSYAECSTTQIVDEMSFGGVIDCYHSSVEFTKLRTRTRKDYEKHLLAIKAKFGKMPTNLLNDRRVRGDFLKWREKEAVASPRQADYGWSVLRRVLSWAKDRSLIDINHATGGGRLYIADRSDKIWTPEHIAAFMRIARPELSLALLLALHTGQRQGDLLRLSWSAFDGLAITLRQSKTGREVFIPCTDALRPWRIRG